MDKVMYPPGMGGPGPERGSEGEIAPSDLR